MDCVSSGYNVLKQKRERSKRQRIKTIFINRLKFDQHKIFGLFMDVYKVFVGNNLNKIFEVISKLKSHFFV